MSVPSNLISNADKLSRHHRVLSNPKRLKIVCKLAESEMFVSEPIRELDISQPILSSGLRKLREENIIQSRREGLTKHYSLVSKEILLLVEGLCSVCDKMEFAA